MNLNLDIEGIEGAGSKPPEPTHNPLLASELTKLLEKVVASENGIKLTYDSPRDAASNRMKIYRHIAKLKAKGVMAFESITISTKLTVLELRNMKLPTIEEIEKC